MKFLKKFEKEKLAEFWCELNCHRIPLELKREISEPTHKEIWPYMSAIAEKITMKACLKKWQELYCGDD